MRSTILSLILLLLTTLAHTQTLYTKALGNPANEPVIFLHGGPGSSSANFEKAAAQKLADNGFYVVFYDRRGEGRSIDPNARYNFQQTFDDLNALYKTYGLQKANIIGFSFGGIIATLYADKYTDHVSSLLLVSSLLSLQETYTTIIRASKKIYQANNDTANLHDIAMMEKLDRNSMAFRSNCFKHASQNGFFATPTPNALAQSIYADFKRDTAYTRLQAQKSEASAGFWKSEHYTNIDITLRLKQLRAKGLKIYALYGKDDRLYSRQQIAVLQKLIGKDHLEYLDSASHYLYNDRQTAFIDAMNKWIK